MDLGTIQMIAVFALIVISLVLYASDAAPLEVTSLGVLCALLILFQLAPVAGTDGDNRLGAARLLSGFANPALIAVLALLVIGDALERTGALDRGAAPLLLMVNASPENTHLHRCTPAEQMSRQPHHMYLTTTHQAVAMAPRGDIDPLPC